MSDAISKKGMSYVAVAVIAVVSLAAGVAVGKYALPSQAATQAPGSNGTFAFGGQNGQGRTGNRAFGGANGAGLVSGQVIKKDDTSLSVQSRDGSMKLVMITPSTKASKMADAAMGDIAVGSQVTVMGTANADGSVTAQNVQLRPENMPGFGGQRPDGQTGGQTGGQQPPAPSVGN